MKRTLIAALIAAASLAGLPARAANVTVTLDVHLGHVLVPPVKSCEVTVAEESDARVVLARAVARECLIEYTTEQRPPYGTFLLSIDHIRGAGEAALDVTYWSMTVNGRYTSYGMDLYRARQGQRLGFTYTTWANCLVPETCI